MCIGYQVGVCATERSFVNYHIVCEYFGSDLLLQKLVMNQR